MHPRWLVSFSVILGSSFTFACSGDDGNTSTQADTMVGDGDGDETTNTGDGDGDSGDGDGDSGDGDGDGDGDPTETGDGDGDGDPTDGCTPGELGCDCNNGLCLGDLECVDGTCTDPQCIPGELGCQCNNGQCLGELECDGGVCVEAEPDPCGNGLTLCDGQCVDTQTNDENCGSCGNACVVRGIYGHCADGQCAPTLSECQVMTDPPISCATVCQMEGLTCAEEQCGGATYFVSGNSDDCQEFFHTGGSGTCQEPLAPYDDYYRCCCAQQ